MPPKTRGVPRTGFASKDAPPVLAIKPEKDGKFDMPPPPDPLPPPKILEPETIALSGCLKVKLPQDLWHYDSLIFCANRMQL
jgi:hypothetical protein